MAALQLPAASCNSCWFNSTCINFSASKKVAAETSGPTGGEVANAEGAPGGASLCAATSYAPMLAPTTPRDALVKNRLRELFKVSPDFLVVPTIRKRRTTQFSDYFGLAAHLLGKCRLAVGRDKIGASTANRFTQRFWLRLKDFSQLGFWLEGSLYLGGIWVGIQPQAKR